MSTVISDNFLPIAAHPCAPQYDELVSTGRAPQLSPLELQHRVLLKGKVKRLKVAEREQNAQEKFALRKALNMSKRYTESFLASRRPSISSAVPYDEWSRRKTSLDEEGFANIIGGLVRAAAAVRTQAACLRTDAPTEHAQSLDRSMRLCVRTE